MITPHLEIVPNPTVDAMDALGGTTIAGVLGTYQHNLDERDALFHKLLAMEDDGSPDYSERYRAVFKAWRAAARRLNLYILLAHELVS